MKNTNPAFLITIDTEGDNIWGDRSHTVGTRNSAYLPRFQALCEKYGFKPTYLTNYEMAVCPVYRELAKDAVQRKAAEVGLHIHAWNSPPVEHLTADDHHFYPYLIDYSPELMRRKIRFLTDLLEDAFEVKMLSHRAGRWAFNELYARELVRAGYAVDCSVTPGHSWAAMPGAPGRFGTDYSQFPVDEYFIDLDDISKPGSSSLLELPMSIRRNSLSRISPALYRKTLGRIGRFRSRELDWFRPKGGNVSEMLRVLGWARRRNATYVEFMLHSSEFMPGGSPTFRDAAAIERLYDDLEQVFAEVARTHVGMTLAEFHARHLAVRARDVAKEPA